MHNVYARPEDIQAYRRDGKFPDGAILVKDVTTVGSEKLTTGQSTWTKDIKIWFVMVKDSKGRFPKNDLWGDGWGWALFEAKDPKKNVATDYTTDCRMCHVPAKKDDWVYVRGYPVLKKPIRTNERECLSLAGGINIWRSKHELLGSGCLLVPCFALLVGLLGADECLAREKEVPATVIVRMTDGLRFKPSAGRRHAGDTVEWQNTSRLSHTVTADARAPRRARKLSCLAGPRLSIRAQIAPGGTYRHTFTVPGTYKYICVPHADLGMVGEVIVQPRPTASPSPAHRSARTTAARGDGGPRRSRHGKSRRLAERSGREDSSDGWASFIRRRPISRSRSGRRGDCRGPTRRDRPAGVRRGQSVLPVVRRYGCRPDRYAGLVPGGLSHRGPLMDHDDASLARHVNRRARGGRVPAGQRQVGDPAGRRRAAGSECCWSSWR